MVKRICALPECGKPHRARGLCSTHYNQQHATTEQRHRKVIVQCTWCSTECTKDASQGNKYSGLFCTLSCRDLWRKATGNNPSPSPEAIANARTALRRKKETRAREARRAKAQARAAAKLARASQGVQGGSSWVSGACRRCGQQFIATAILRDSPRYCSDRCANRSSEARRQRRVREAEHDNYSRIEIFERDGWRCHLCRRLVDRSTFVPDLRAPTIDHLLPLAKGGSDTRANVATAHYQCNSIKGARTDSRSYQLPLIGQPVTFRS